MSSLSRERMRATVERYYRGCNLGDRTLMESCFVPDAAHYFPGGAPQGTFAGAAAISAGWARAVEVTGSAWTIDRLLLDEELGEAAIEWTHFKTALGARLRGTEIVRFAPDGLITEIRAYYAAPAVSADTTHELGDFDYAGRGYPTSCPTDLERATPHA